MEEADKFSPEDLTLLKKAWKEGSEGSLPQGVKYLDEVVEASTEVDLQKLAKELISDSNPKFPLSEKNAEMILNDLKPSGYTPKKIAGPGGAGADVVFEGPNGELFKIEVKSIEGGFNSFNRHLSHAAQKQAAGDLVFIQVKSGTDVGNWLNKFRGSRKHLLSSDIITDIGKLKLYQNTEIIIFDEAGKILVNRQTIF